MYKYSCRKCPIRNRCIQESDTSPSVKDMIRNAFSARTDTLATWGVLQKNCLLIKAEERRARVATEESLLSKRLREVRESKQKPDQDDTDQNNTTPDYLRPVPRLKPLGSKTTRRIGTNPIESSPPPEHPRTATGPLAGKSKAEEVRPCWLTVNNSRRHISLPNSGELVLGRFDPHLGLPPDIDLAYEDAESHTVSRRHARIVGFNGRYTIEDLGSSNGVFLNGRRLSAGPSPELRPGDQVKIGNIDLTYDIVPVFFLAGSTTSGERQTLMVTATGRKYTVTPPKDVVIGRSDRHVDFVPDIDLNSEGEVAVRVSRRHAIITWRANQPYLEDLGSGFGTRINGETLLIGHVVPLKPGDHIWLGGCVLAYDIAL
jgi:pSer/pThr/pTyr-binding forkhead associated (FHA) protein